jgi:hypothetical protein
MAQSQQNVSSEKSPLQEFFFFTNYCLDYGNAEILYVVVISGSDGLFEMPLGFAKSGSIGAFTVV